MASKNLIDRLVNTISSGKPPEVLAALKEIRAENVRGPRIISALSEVIQNPQGWHTPEIRAEAMRTMTAVYPRLQIALAQRVLRSTEPMELGAKKAAIESLGKIQLRPSIKVLAWVLDPSNEYVDNSLHKNAVSALASNKKPQAVQELVKVAIVSSEETAKEAINALAKIGTAPAIRGLALMLRREEDSSARALAATALGNSGSPEGAKALRNFLRREMAAEHHSRPELVAAAATALGNFNDRNSTITLAKVVRDRSMDHSVRHYALDALKSIETPLAGRLLAKVEPTLHEEKRIVAPQPGAEIAKRIEKKPPFGEEREPPRIAARAPQPPQPTVLAPNPFPPLAQEDRRHKKKIGTS